MSPRISFQLPIFLGMSLCLAACGGGGQATNDSSPPATGTVKRVLFVGNSFTHGRYQPVRKFNNGGQSSTSGGSSLVVDENAGASGARAEDDETGPFGGIPGIVAAFASESGLNAEIHIEAISSATLQGHYNSALDVIADPKWSAVVLQEQSTRPLPSALADGGNSNPSAFCSAVQSLELAVHKMAPSAAIFLYETWPRADGAQSLAGDPGASGFNAAYNAALAQLGDAYHDANYGAAARDGMITAVAPVGEAWQRAWADGVANPNPYSGSSALPSLWYGIQSANDPVISAPDRYHPSIYGAYLSALVLFQQISGIDARTLGSGETAATALGISSTIAVQLQQVAALTVQQATTGLRNSGRDPCANN
jgi:hypothetical protein